MWCSKKLFLETLSILIYANDLKNTNSMLLLFDPIAFLDYISLFLSQGESTYFQQSMKRGRTLTNALI